MPPNGVGFPLGPLEGQQHAATDLERILEALEPRRERLPVIVAEVGVPRASADDEVVVLQPGPVGEFHGPRVDVHAFGLGEQDIGVA